MAMPSLACSTRLRYFSSDSRKAFSALFLSVISLTMLCMYATSPDSSPMPETETSTGIILPSFDLNCFSYTGISSPSRSLCNLSSLSGTEEGMTISLKESSLNSSRVYPNNSEAFLLASMCPPCLSMMNVASWAPPNN